MNNAIQKRLIGVMSLLVLSCTLLSWGKPAPTAPRFEKALPGYTYRFPKDHYSHPTYKTEWWYFTGNVTDSNQRPFGYELTFFRANPGLNPCSTRARRGVWIMFT